MILWFGKKKKKADNGETPIEPNPPQDAGIEAEAAPTPAIETAEDVLNILAEEKANEKKGLFGGLFGSKKKEEEDAAIDAEVKADVENYFKDPYDEDAIVSDAPFRDDDDFEPNKTPDNTEQSVPSSLEPTSSETPETDSSSDSDGKNTVFSDTSDTELSVPLKEPTDESLSLSENTTQLDAEPETEAEATIDDAPEAVETPSETETPDIAISEDETKAALALAEDTFEEDTPAYDITENQDENSDSSDNAEASSTLDVTLNLPVATPPEAPTQDDISPMAETKKPGFFARMTQGLQRSSSKLADGISSVFTKKKLDDDTLEELEDLLISSDLGASVAMRVCDNIRKDRFDKEVTDEEIKQALAQEITNVLKPREEILDLSDGPSPRVVLFVGVNGSGKTTTIGKIASKLSAQGANILLAAGDTFRAAAVEQLKVWAERANAGFLSRPDGADSAGLAYDAVKQATTENRDLVLIDTAGRLQNRTELMDELAKVVRAIRKIEPTAPHEVILVLDATVGQNALSQVEAFKHTAGVTGLVMTKLDGTAKGGVLVAIADKHALPIHFVGIGEKAEDLHPFSASAFANALVGLSDDVTKQ